MINMDIQEGRISEMYVVTYLGEMGIKESSKWKIKRKEKHEKRLVL